MEILIQNFIAFICTYADCMAIRFTSLSDGDLLATVTFASTLAFVPGAVGAGNILESVLAAIRRWRGGIDDKFSAIANLAVLLEAGITKWNVPEAMIIRLKESRDSLQELISKCRSVSGSPIDRVRRNMLLKTTISYCLSEVKVWALSSYFAGVMTINDVHQLGFLAPGEIGGHRTRKEPTDALAEVKVTIINTDFIRVVIDRAGGDNAALVRHGWPKGVRQALIVILAANGTTEVYRLLTNTIHNDIAMPEGSRGQQFIIKAAFLQHPGDTPKFGAEPTFSMPLNTEDLAATLNRQHHNDFNG
jgi:hypothetical protein